MDTIPPSLPPLLLLPLPLSPTFPPISPTLTGVPLCPSPMVDSITSRGALISWPPPFSILPVTQYEITWVQVDTGEDNSTTIDAGMTQLLLTNLQPNRNYSVTVVAVNRVGPSLPSDPVVFTTAEDGMFLLLKIYCVTAIAEQVTSLSFHSLCSTRGSPDHHHNLLNST